MPWEKAQPRSRIRAFRDKVLGGLEIAAGGLLMYSTIKMNPEIYKDHSMTPLIAAPAIVSGGLFVDGFGRIYNQHYTPAEGEQHPRQQAAQLLHKATPYLRQYFAT